MGKIINEKLKKLFNDWILSHLDYTDSEILVTILYQQNLREELYRLRSDIKNIYAESGN